MKKITQQIVIFLLSSGTMSLYAQRAVVATGGDATGSGGSSSYSVGQVTYTYNSGSTGSSNMGVQQPYEFFSVGMEENEAISLTLSVFPNPSQSVVNLLVESQDTEKMFYQLFDAGGKLIHKRKVTQSVTVVPMEPLAPGNYLLTVLSDQTTVKTFKIIKKD